MSKRWNLPAAFSITLLVLSACGYRMSESERLAEAEVAMQEGDYRAAEVQLKTLLAANPEQRAARAMLARIHLGLNDVDSAEKELQRARELGADYADLQVLQLELHAARGNHAEILAYLGMNETGMSEVDRARFRGEALIGLQSADAAADHYRDWLDRDPASVEAQVGAAKAQALQGNAAAAAGQLTSLLTLHPEHADGWLALALIHYNNGDYPAARAAYRQALSAGQVQANVQRTIMILIGLSDTDLILQDDAAARESISLLKAYAPSAPQTILQSARLSQLEGDFPEAARKLQRLDQLVPNNSQVLMFLASVQWRMGNPHQAANLLNRVVSLSPANLQARKMLAQLQLGLANTQAARQTLEPLLDSADAEVAGLLAIADLQQGDRQRAVQRLQATVAEFPDDIDSRLQLAELRQQLGDPDAALELIRGVAPGLRRDSIELRARRGLQQHARADAIRDAFLNTGTAEALRIAAGDLIASGRIAGAREALLAALVTSPEDVPTLLEIAALELSHGSVAEANNFYQRANAIDGQNLDAILGLGRVALSNGNREMAERYLRLGRDQHPTAAEPRLLLTRLALDSGDILAAEREARDLLRTGVEEPAIKRIVGRVFMAVGALHDAEAQFAAAVSQMPSSIGYLTDLAYVQLAQEKLSDAATTLATALSIDATSLTVNAAMLEVDIRRGEFEAAERRMQNLLRRRPRDPQTLKLAGELKFAQQDYSAAATYFGSAVSNGGELDAAIRQVDSMRRGGASPDAARGPLETWLAQHPADLRAEMLVAQELQRDGERVAARHAYERLVEKQPQNVAFLNNLAWELQQAGNLESALELAQRAFSLAPEGTDLAANVADTLGWIYFSLGIPDASVTYLRAATTQMPHNSEFQYHLAAALALAGDSAQASAVLTELLEANREFPSRLDAEALLADL